MNLLPEFSCRKLEIRRLFFPRQDRASRMRAEERWDHVGRDGRFPAPKLAPHTAVISPSCFSLGGGRRGVQYEYGGDKENIPQDEDDEDGPILYRDDGEMEDEGESHIFYNFFFF